MDTDEEKSGKSGELLSLDEAEILVGKGRLLFPEPLKTILETIPGLLLILDDNQEIVFYNRIIPGIFDKAEPYGMHFGEAIDCLRTAVHEGACGNSEFCELCGVFQLLSSARRGHSGVNECRIVRRGFPSALDLRINASLIHLQGRDYITLGVEDIFYEKRQQVMENAFFNGVINSAESLRASAFLLSDTNRASMKNIREMVFNLSQKLINEIKSIREITLAEGARLTLKQNKFSSLELLYSTVNTMIFFEEAKGRDIVVLKDSADAEITGDRTLTGRVLNGMIMNALEASEPGETVKTGCYLSGSNIEFRVHNSSPMSREVQLQLFQRSFSTKGRGRGIGTYAMKLLTEEYLNGTISFTSSPEEGTTFTASLPVGAVYSPLRKWEEISASER